MAASADRELATVSRLVQPRDVPRARASDRHGARSSSTRASPNGSQDDDASAPRVHPRPLRAPGMCMGADEPEPCRLAAAGHAARRGRTDPGHHGGRPRGVVQADARRSLVDRAREPGRRRICAEQGGTWGPGGLPGPREHPGSGFLGGIRGFGHVARAPGSFLARPPGPRSVATPRPRRGGIEANLWLCSASA